MPELPEVETVRRVLREVLPGRTITAVELRQPAMLRGQSPTEFLSGLMGQRIRGVERRGKFLLLGLDRRALVIHLGMTGQVFFCRDDVWRPRPAADLPDKHTHLSLSLTGRAALYCRDARRFGRYGLITPGREPSFLERLGPEPLGPRFTADFLGRRLEGRVAAVKAVLLDQRIAAGLGNIYADESLFRAGIHPGTAAGRLSRAELRALHRALRRVLREGIHHGGTTLSDYLDPHHRRGTFQMELRVYGREGRPCLRCGTTIVKTRIAQRGTHWCPRCQARDEARAQIPVRPTAC